MNLFNIYLSYFDKEDLSNTAVFIFLSLVMDATVLKNILSSTPQKYEVLGRIHDKAWHELEMIYIVRSGHPDLAYI